eukprot:5535330-Prymnesium_polylepis.1
MTLASVGTEPAPRLRAFLGQCGLDVPASMPTRTLRTLATQLLSQPHDPLISPIHPALAQYSRPALLKIRDPTVIRGEAMFQVLKKLVPLTKERLHAI